MNQASGMAAHASRPPEAEDQGRQQPMWRIGSQIPPSRMMMPCDGAVGVEVTTGPVTGRGSAVAADAGPTSATTAVGITSRARPRRRMLNIRASFRIAWGVADNDLRRAD